MYTTTTSTLLGENEYTYDEVLRAWRFDICLVHRLNCIFKVQTGLDNDNFESFTVLYMDFRINGDVLHDNFLLRLALLIGRFIEWLIG